MRDLHLDGLEAPGNEALGLVDHSVAAHLAETAAAIDWDFGTVMAPQTVQRHIGGLADDIPQGDVDGGHGHGGDAAAPGGEGCTPKVAPDRFHRCGVPAQNQRGDCFLDAGADGTQHRGVEQVQIAHPADARGGLDLDHDEVSHSFERQALQVRRIWPGRTNQGDADIADCSVGHGGYSCYGAFLYCVF